MNGYEWMTHQPIIRTALEIYKPQFVLELGVGHYSTPLFLEYGCEYRGIDTEQKWIDDMKTSYGVDIEIQDISFISPGLNYGKITQRERAQIRRYYERIELPYSFMPRLLFADQDATCRLISINSLSFFFDFIIYHDHDEAGIENNSYELINRAGFNSYFLSTPMTGAGLMVRDSFDVGFDKTKEVFDKYAELFLAEHPDCSEIKFQRYE